MSRRVMSRYYKVHSAIYDATRWMFLYGRTDAVQHLGLCNGAHVFEVGCGTGSNFESILKQIGKGGRLTGIDCSPSMLTRARRRVEQKGWRNVQLIDAEFGTDPIQTDPGDAVLFSYSLSMIPDWERSLAAARQLLRSGGRIAIVDFGLPHPQRAARAFSSWLALNHVSVNRHYRKTLAKHFHPDLYRTEQGLLKLWTYFTFIGLCREP